MTLLDQVKQGTRTREQSKVIPNPKIFQKDETGDALRGIVIGGASSFLASKLLDIILTQYSIKYRYMSTSRKLEVRQRILSCIHALIAGGIGTKIYWEYLQKRQKDAVQWFDSIAPYSGGYWIYDSIASALQGGMTDRLLQNIASISWYLIPYVTKSGRIYPGNAYMLGLADCMTSFMWLKQTFNFGANKPYLNYILIMITVFLFAFTRLVHIPLLCADYMQNFMLPARAESLFHGVMLIVLFGLGLNQSLEIYNIIRGKNISQISKL